MYFQTLKFATIFSLRPHRASCYVATKIVLHRDVNFAASRRSKNFVVRELAKDRVAKC